jgi:short-subunit dehydrogenase involved in D-alanine esterification of teichoic acids
LEGGKTGSWSPTILREFARRFLEAYPQLYVLINNVGVWLTERRL